ncbi:SpaA isopeptide-forming pilin-related protein [Lactococcus lactis]|uniref:SpaA isopeptide-forming pilin-related protein n=1 Tax=Lactococcus lactis TaxID=1358 RepID=UPI003877C097
MSKKKNGANIPIASKKIGCRLWKSGKALKTTAGVSVITLGSIALALAVNANAASPTVKSAFPPPPSDTTVNWENDKPLYYEIDQTGKEHPKPQLLLGDKTTPAWCLGLGVPLPNNSIPAQQSKKNEILNKLTDEQIAVLNNVQYLGRKAGDLEGYAEAQHATYKLLDEAGDSVNQTKDVIVKDNTLLHDANKIKTGADNLIKEAKKMRELPSFNNQTIQIIQGVPKKITNTKGVLGNFPYVKVNIDGVKQVISGNDLTITADATSKLGVQKKAITFVNKDGGISPSDLPYTLYSTDGDDTGTLSQTVTATQDPSTATATVNINVIGLGEFTLSKSSTNDAFSKAMMDGAEFTAYTTSDDKPVKLSDGQDGYPITVTHGTSADKTNLVLKMGKDGLVGAKNLDKSKKYYAKETKAPAGFALNAKKIPITFDKDSKFNADDSNYQDNVSVQDIPTGSVSGTKVDADTKTTTPQGIGNLKNVTYGAFWEDGTPMKWSDGLTDETENSTENLPITLTAGTKVNDTNVEFKVDDKSNFGFQNIPLVKNKTRFYLQETATSPGYSLFTKKIWVDLSETNHVNVDTNDFDESGIKAEDKAAAIQIIFDKAQDVNGSLPGMNGAGFEGQPIDGNKEKTVKVTSGPGTDANGFQVNGLTVFDGKANIAAGNANPDGLAVANWKFVEINPPKGTVAINPFTLKSAIKSDKNGHPVSYHFVFTDDVTHQTIMESDVDASKLVDNNIALKVNLGTMVDKAKLPTIKTKAHSADGDQIIQIKEVSKTTRMYDDATFINVEKGDQIFSYLHRIVTDKDGKITDKIVKTLNFVADDETVKTQKHRFETTADTTKDLDIPEGATVTYVFTEDDFDGNSNPKTDEPKAKHDDLKDQDQTLTVEKEKPTTPSSSTPPSTPEKSSKPIYNIIIPNTGAKVAGYLTALGVMLLGAVSFITYKWFKKSKKEDEGSVK